MLTETHSSTGAQESQITLLAIALFKLTKGILLIIVGIGACTGMWRKPSPIG
jgi:hypothetical protein